MDASPRETDGGLFAHVDARALTSLAAVGLAMTVVCVIAIAGHLTAGNASSGEATSAPAPTPLVNLGVEIETPEINVTRREQERESEEE